MAQHTTNRNKSRYRASNFQIDRISSSKGMLTRTHNRNGLFEYQGSTYKIAFLSEDSRGIEVKPNTRWFHLLGRIPCITKTYFILFYTYVYPFNTLCNCLLDVLLDQGRVSSVEPKSVITTTVTGWNLLTARICPSSSHLWNFNVFGDISMDSSIQRWITKSFLY